MLVGALFVGWLLLYRLFCLGDVGFCVSYFGLFGYVVVFVVLLVD